MGFYNVTEVISEAEAREFHVMRDGLANAYKTSDIPLKIPKQIMEYFGMNSVYDDTDKLISIKREEIFKHVDISSQHVSVQSKRVFIDKTKITSDYICLEFN